MNSKSLLIATFVVAAACTLNPVLALQSAPAIAKVGVQDANNKSAPTAAKVSINKASQQQLEAIPGIGEKKALAILDYIKSHGPIKNQQQLMEVKGIGAKLAEKINSFVSY